MTTATSATFEVTVTYNGVPRPVTANSHQAVQALLQHALNEFEIHQGPENLALYLPGASQPINENSSVTDAGINAQSILELRPRVVRGGV